MYYLFVNHHWPPSVYFDAHESDKRVILGFIRAEVEHYKTLQDDIGG